MDGVPTPLITPAWRRPALVAGLVGVTVFLALAVLLFHGHHTAFDSWAFRVLLAHIPGSSAQFLLGFTEPALSVLLLALTAAVATSVRRFDLALLALVGPAVATALASDVAKPVIHRTLLGGTVGSYPSGHETGVTCTATVVLIALGQLPLRRTARYAAAAVLAGWVVVAAVALTRNFYHYATDTIGAMGLSIALMLGLAALLDAIVPALGRRGVDRPRSDATAPRPAPLPVDGHEDQLTPRA